jgi:hypothetical protein
MQDNSLLTPWGASALLGPMEGYILRLSWITFQPLLYEYMDPSIEELDKQLFKATEQHKSNAPKAKTPKKRKKN